MTPLIYPRSIAVEGNPACHGLADLRLVIDENGSDDIHIVVTTDQLVSLGRQIQRKLDAQPYRLVNNA